MAYPVSLGNNNLSSNSKFFQRERYDNISFPDQGEDAEKPQVRNLNIFYKKPFYGRINSDSIPIMSGKYIFSNSYNDFELLENLTYMKKINIKKDLYAMNFVVDAYKDMEQYINNACATRSTAAVASRITPLNVVKAYENPRIAYEVYISQLFGDFINTIPDTRTDKIKNFDDFYNLFSKFLLEQSKEKPILFSSFIASRFCSSLVSGLCFEIDTLSYSDDGEKTQLFLNDVNFDFFAKGVARYGFYLDKHVPFRIFADLNSEVMIEYMKKYNLNDKEAVFKQQFFSAHLLDLNLIKFFFLSSYFSFRRENMQYETFKLQKNCNFTKKYSVNDRQHITSVEFNKKYNNNIWLSFYIDLKFIENKISTNVESFSQTLKKTSLQKIVDNNIPFQLSLTLKNINYQLINFYNYKELNAALTTR